jgi:tetratricopeptide (TPR) repeat protein
MMGDMSLITAYEQMHDASANGNHAVVLRIARHVLMYFPHIIKTKLCLCESLLAVNELTEAASLYHDVLRSDPENIDAYVGLSIIAERQGDLRVAEEHLEHAIEMRPEVVDVRTRLVNLYRRSARHDVYLQLSRIGLARLFVKGSMFEQAISEFRSLQALHPTRVDITIALAETLWRNGDERESYEISQTLLKTDPDILKANYFVARYQAGRDADASQHCWMHAQAFDPFFDIARELFGHATLPSAATWVLPEVQAVDVSAKGVQRRSGPQVQSKEVLYPAIPDLDYGAVLQHMRSEPRHGMYAQTDDCACMGEGGFPDVVGMNGGAPDGASHPDVAAPELLAGMLDHTTAHTEQPDTATNALPHVPSHDLTVEMVRGVGRVTTPVSPDVSEVVTETVQAPQGSNRGVPFLVHQAIDDDDRFLANVLGTSDTAQSESRQGEPVVAALAELAPLKITINTTQLQTISSLDDLYALLARLEISHTPSPTEDLREVVARILGGGFVDAKKVTPIPDPRFTRQASQAAAATLDSMRERGRHDRSITTSRSAKSVAAPTSKPADAPPAASAANPDSLLADLFLSSRSAEMPVGVSAALPRAAAPAPVTPPSAPPVSTPPVAVAESSVAKPAAATSDRAHDNAMLQSLLVSQNASAEPIALPGSATGYERFNSADAPAYSGAQAFDMSNLAVSQGMRLHDFPETGSRPAFDANDILRDVGITTGELSRAGLAVPAVAAGPMAESMMNQPTAKAMVSAPTGGSKTAPTGSHQPPIQTNRTQTAGASTAQMNEYLRSLQDDPENAPLRLAVARAATPSGMFETAMVQYRHLIRTTMLLDDVVADLRDILANEADAQKRRECSRLLGNAYARQGRVQEAVEAYRMTNLNGPPPSLA